MDLSFLDQEYRADVLREYAKLAMTEAERAREECATLKNASAEKMEQIRLAMKDKLTRLQTKLFDRGTEKTDQDLRSRGAGDGLAHGESLNPSDETKKKKNAKDRRLPERDTLYDMSSEELRDEAELRGYPLAQPSDWQEIKGLYCPVPANRRQYRPTYWTTPDLIAVN